MGVVPPPPPPVSLSLLIRHQVGFQLRASGYRGNGVRGGGGARDARFRIIHMFCMLWRVGFKLRCGRGW